MENEVHQIIEALDKVGQKAGVVGEHMWQVLVRQALIDSITYTVMFIILMAGFVYFVQRFSRYVKSLDEHKIAWNDKDHIILAYVGMAIAGAIITLALLLSADTIVAGFVNPEYPAIKELLSALK